MLPTSIIAKKRDSKVLSSEEIQFIVQGIVDGSIPDYQIASWAMAVLCRGMNAQETAALTDCMLSSGSRLARASDRPRVDKHSTGGLGDKVSLILAPLLACFDVDVPMLSGRGLGITGGTLDKLESYPGYRCDLSEQGIQKQLTEIGCVITGTTDAVAPADKKLYLLRDVTATVPSIALITGSIMSKKLAASLDALVLDVKHGSGAFMQDKGDAQMLAASLVDTGQRMGMPTKAVLSDMNQPLGRMVGNACEANEAVQVLKGTGPEDVRRLTLTLCAELLCSVAVHENLTSAEEALTRQLDCGAAFEKYCKMVKAQGGQFSEELPLAALSVFAAREDGWIESIDGQSVGEAVIELGGGRKKLGDRIDHCVGLEMLVRIGDQVTRGQPLIRMFARTPTASEAARTKLESAIQISEHSVSPLPLFF